MIWQFMSWTPKYSNSEHVHMSVKIRNFKNSCHSASANVGRLLNFGALLLTHTIRGQILIACLAMTIITGVLGIYASYHIRRGGELVTETYDRSLMAINYARAASADFALMQVIASSESVKSIKNPAP